MIRDSVIRYSDFKVRISVFKVAYQADANPHLVVFRVTSPGMRPVHLLVPAEGGFDVAISHSLTIADDEVVPNSEPGFAALILVLQVGLMNRFDTASFGRGGSP